MKEDFPILNDGKLVYLDNSATTQKPKVVIEVIQKFYTESNANVHRGIHKLSMKATLEYQKAHEVVAKFIGASQREIIFTSGTTQSLNMLARSLGRDLQPGDEILLTEMEHHSNIVPWQEIAKEKGCVVKYIPVKNYVLDLACAEKLISSKTKILAVTHMSNVLGTINPVKKLAKMVHKVNGVIVVDGAQSVPHFKIDVKDLDCDFLAFSGHKMCGPTGIGVLYGKTELLSKLNPSSFGGGMINEVTLEKSTWADIPERFEPGTPNIAGAIGLMAAVNYLEKIGMDKVWRDSEELTTYALEKLSSVEGIELIGPAVGGLSVGGPAVDGSSGSRGGVISFVVKGMHPHDVSEILDRDNIAVRAGHHCAMPLMEKLGLSGTTRASFYVYNTKQDVDALIQALVGLRTFNESSVSMYGTELPDNLSEEEEIYKENIIDHYREPRNKKELAEYTFSHRELNPLCGDQIRLYLKVEGNVVEDVSFTGDGCAISQASISMLTEEIKGKQLNEVQGFSEANVLELLGIPISHARYKCALLSLKTLHGALNVRD
jgi:cysteine desulfurase / selenocysteine lyase